MCALYECILLVCMSFLTLYGVGDGRASSRVGIPIHREIHCVAEIEGHYPIVWEKGRERDEIISKKLKERKRERERNLIVRKKNQCV